MSQTIPDIEIGDSWVDLNTTSGVAVGSEFIIQNKKTTWILLYEGTDAPLSTSTAGVYLTNLDRPDGKCTVRSGSLKVWAKSTVSGVKGYINVQGVV